MEVVVTNPSRRNKLSILKVYSNTVYRWKVIPHIASVSKEKYCISSFSSFIANSHFDSHLFLTELTHTSIT